MKYILYFVYLICYFDYAYNQYVPVNLTRKPNYNSCEHSGNTALVEHFFNIIFSEFHDTPPVCVCVKMCIGQSTYCYPNGCLKRDVDKNTLTNNMQSIPRGQDNGNQYMLVDNEKNDFMADFFKRIDVAEPKIDKKEKKSVHDMRPDPFKDKYKMLIKHKRLPKVQLRYNLREQVKNMKSDIIKIETIDLSNTRWPMKKNRRINKQRIDSELSTYNSTPKSNTFFVSVGYTDKVSSSSKYFKRDLTGKSDNVTNQKDAAPNNTTFSLESIIDNLIELNIVKNDTDFNVQNINNDNLNEVDGNLTEDIINGVHTTTLATTIKNGEFDDESSIGNSNNITNTNIMVSLNISNDIIVDGKDIEKNTNTVHIGAGDKYSDDKDKEKNSNAFENLNEMMTKLAKQIEKQNNTSMEIMKQIIGDTKVIDDVTLKLRTDQVNDHTTTDGISETTNNPMAKDTKPAAQNELKFIKSNRKRLRRKLENSKLN